MRSLSSLNLIVSSKTLSNISNVFVSVIHCENKMALWKATQEWSNKIAWQELYDTETCSIMHLIIRQWSLRANL